jgi:hypothetical protein
MPVDPKKLKDFQKDLEDRTDNTKGWLYANKIDAPADIRVLDPLPNLDGMYFLEIPCHWIGGKRLISPAVFGEPDIVESLLEEITALARGDEDLRALLNKTGKNGRLISERTEYWLPVLQFKWNIKDESIEGIWDANNQPDVNLIEGFIKDQTAKVLVTTPKLMAAINKIVTSRGNQIMFDREKGFNLVISKSGAGTKTEYSAVQTDVLPMPAKYYQPENVPDLVRLCKAGMRTDEYMKAILFNYFYGDPLPDAKDETSYRYPDARVEGVYAAAHEEAEDENQASENGEATPPVQTTPPRPGGATAPPASTPKRPGTAAPAAGSPRRPGGTMATSVGPKRPGTAAAPTAPAGNAPAPAPGNGRRNLLNDVRE